MLIRSLQPNILVYYATSILFDLITRQGFSNTLGAPGIKDVTGLVIQDFESMTLHFGIRLNIGHDRIKSKWLNIAEELIKQGHVWQKV